MFLRQLFCTPPAKTTSLTKSSSSSTPTHRRPNRTTPKRKTRKSPRRRNLSCKFRAATLHQQRSWIYVHNRSSDDSPSRRLRTIQTCPRSALARVGGGHASKPSHHGHSPR